MSQAAVAVPITAMQAVMDDGSDVRGWIYSLVAGLACVLGATVVFWDVILRKLPFVHGSFDLRESSTFQIASMSLGAGVLLFSAFHNLVPEAQEYLRSSYLPLALKRLSGVITIIAFFVGGLLCLGLSEVVHHFTPENIVHCGDHEDGTQHDKAIDHPGCSDESTDDAHPQPAVAGDDSSENPALNSGTRSDHQISGEQQRLNRPRGFTNPTRNSIPQRPSIHSLKLPSHSCNSSYSRSQSHQRRGFRSFSSRFASAKPLPNTSSSHLDQHYHARCNKHGACAGYTDPCYGATCVCDGHEVKSNLFRLWGRDHRDSDWEFRPRPRSRETERPGSGLLTQRTDIEACEISPLLQSHSQSDHGRGIASREGGSSSVGSVDGQDQDDPLHHHHHIDDDSKMLRIGVQTSVAICLHKFPEGFITFVSAHADRKLGLTLFLAIALHNISEGAVIAYPLLVATGSRLRAFIYASILGGLSGPIGALLGFALTRSGLLHEADPWTPALYGILFAMVAGFMTTIASQSMLPTAIKEDHTNARTTTLWFVAGAGIIFIAGTLSGQV